MIFLRAYTLDAPSAYGLANKAGDEGFDTGGVAHGLVVRVTLVPALGIVTLLDTGDGGGC